MHAPPTAPSRTHCDDVLCLYSGLPRWLQRPTPGPDSTYWPLPEQSRDAQETGLLLERCVAESFSVFQPELPLLHQYRIPGAILRQPNAWKHIRAALRWCNTSKVRSVPDEYKPIILSNGVRQRFPAPTRKIKRPAAWTAFRAVPAMSHGLQLILLRLWADEGSVPASLPSL